MTATIAPEVLAAEVDPGRRVHTRQFFTDPDGQPVHPHAISQTFERIARRARVPVIRFHDVRHTHGTLLIKEGIPVKIVSERLGHANIAFTIETYQHVLPGMQSEAAATCHTLLAPTVPPANHKPVEPPEEHRLKPVERPCNDEDPGR